VEVRTTTGTSVRVCASATALITRDTLPRITAHESALAGGTRLTIPDFGDAPSRR